MPSMAMEDGRLCDLMKVVSTHGDRDINISFADLAPDLGDIPSSARRSRTPVALSLAVWTTLAMTSGEGYR